LKNEEKIGMLIKESLFRRFKRLELSVVEDKLRLAEQGYSEDSKSLLKNLCKREDNRNHPNGCSTGG